ncbi:hypothetical protein Ddye_003848 [Dipteronia dyeriana]|uniref:Uncharacterized protein n=1 Tax=Dipteronia dyeriana TaxID=168575 RepID=A0AAE0CVU9_9ROSI|nr:hypothetical protein Ddye_003848 [Dipteronia dyeriana]
MPILVRSSKLSMEWLNSDLLCSIGGMFGRMCKVDPITENQARGRFARICVEIDILKPLLASLNIDDRIVRVEYESLGLVYFKCGRYGHSKDMCRECVMDTVVEEEVNTNATAAEVSEKQKESSYGPWLLVSYEKQNNRFSKGKNGRFANANNNSNERRSFVGKTGGHNFVKNKKGGTTEIIPSKNFQSKNNNKDKKKTKGKSPKASSVFGSCFDILNEEVEVMVVERGSQAQMKVNETPIRKEKVVLSEITNQTSKQGHKIAKFFSHSNKKIIKKSERAGLGMASSSKNKGQEVIQKLDVVIKDIKGLDNVSVLCQFLKDVSNVKAKFVDGKDISELKLVLHNDRSFDMLASKLEEAMVLVFEQSFLFSFIFHDLCVECEGSRRLGFDNSFVVNAEGFSRGIWLLWNDSKVKLHIVASSWHNITALIVDHNFLWVLTTVYVNPCVTSIRLLWGYLDAIRKCFNMLWLIAGDFNEITISDEKSGCRRSYSNSGFASWIDRNELVDLGFLGPKFTWMNNRGVGGEIWERLEPFVLCIGECIILRGL